MNLVWGSLRPLVERVDWAAVNGVVLRRKRADEVDSF